MQQIFKQLINKPKLFLALLLAFVAFFGSFATKLEIDASTQTLLLKEDKDLEIWRKNARKYGTNNFLIAAFSPKNGEIFTQENINKINQIATQLEQISGVNSVLTLLDMPLLMASNSSFASLLESVPTLKNTNNTTLAKTEFELNPLYKENLISKDLSTTAIIINLRDHNATLAEGSEFFATQERAALKAYRDELRKNESRLIGQVREVLAQNRGEDTLFLGGMNMIANDMISYIKSDLFTYGLALSGIIALCLWLFFRRVIFVVLPLGVCALSVITASGILGFLGYEITVVSSNFIALQLIVTISLIIHLLVAYIQFSQELPDATQKELVFLALKERVFGCFFAVFTTIVGFLSLCISDIAPVIALGAMMSLGVGVSFFITFIAFASVMSLCKKRPFKPSFLHRLKFNEFCARLALNHKRAVLGVTLLCVGFGVWGASTLRVENSFIGYFKEKSEIYQGMKLIDEKLGGTIPFDVVVKFSRTQNISHNSLSSGEAWFSPNHTDEILAGHKAAQALNLAQNLVDEEVDEFEFEDDGEQNAYWFSQNKLRIAKMVTLFLQQREFVGYVGSLDLLLQIGKKLNANTELDSLTLAVLYKTAPESYKKILLSPYVSFEDNELHFSARMRDSDPQLRRNEFISQLRQDLNEILQGEDASAEVSGIMVLYNNVLQSLFASQFDTLGLLAAVLMVIFIVIFRSLKLAAFALLSNAVAIVCVFGVMGAIGIPLDIMSITIAAIALGIGVDNSIHYIHTYQNNLKNCGSKICAVTQSSAGIGVAMYYTSVVIFVGFATMVLSNFYPTIYFGLFTSLTMALMLLAALILLPAMLLIRLR